MSFGTEKPPSEAQQIRSSLADVFGSKGGLTTRAPHRGTRVMTNEGPRGYSTRASVYLRHAAYLLVVVLCSALTHYAMDAAGPYSIDGGRAMFVLATIVLVVGALATMAYPPQRNQVLEQVRHYVFGMMVLPGTGIALVLWLVKGLVSVQSKTDAFSATVDTGLLMVFGAVLIMPPVVFLRLIAGIRTLHRSTRDDQETMALWSRQDGRQV